MTSNRLTAAASMRFDVRDAADRTDVSDVCHSDRENPPNISCDSARFTVIEFIGRNVDAPAANCVEAIADQIPQPFAAIEPGVQRQPAEREQEHSGHEIHRRWLRSVSGRSADRRANQGEHKDCQLHGSDCARSDRDRDHVLRDFPGADVVEQPEQRLLECAGRVHQRAEGPGRPRAADQGLRGGVTARTTPARRPHTVRARRRPAHSDAVLHSGNPQQGNRPFGKATGKTCASFQATKITPFRFPQDNNTYRYLFVQLDHYPRNTIVIEDNRASESNTSF